MEELRVVSDITIFKIINEKLCLLIVQRDKVPYVWKWCLPGGFVRTTETVEQTAMRILKWETGISQAFMQQFHVFSGIERVAFIGILTTNQEVKPWPEQQQAMFCPIKDLPPLVFDHKEVARFAYKRLIQWIEDGSLVEYFLPKIFTISSLQQVYEIILQRSYEKRNFRRVIEKNHNLKATKYKEKNVAHRPATLYSFSK
jgi:8-oxo-dGTP diphosphatase